MTLATPESIVGLELLVLALTSFAWETLVTWLISLLLPLLGKTPLPCPRYIGLIELRSLGYGCFPVLFSDRREFIRRKNLIVNWCLHRYVLGFE